jgi:hypothetical protein
MGFASDAEPRGNQGGKREMHMNHGLERVFIVLTHVRCTGRGMGWGGWQYVYDESGSTF